MNPNEFAEEDKELDKLLGSSGALDTTVTDNAEAAALFLGSQTAIHGLTLRDMTAGDLMTFLSVRNAFFVGREEGATIYDHFYSVMEVLFVGSRASSREASQLARRADFKDLVLAFADTLPYPEDIEDLCTQVRAYVDGAAKTRVKAEPPEIPGSKATEGNG